MKKIIFGILAITLFSLNTIAQNTGIGTSTPQTRLQVKDTIKTVVMISSKNYLDTTQLIFNNRNAFNQGTDMILSSNTEAGLRFSSSSDIANNNHDSIVLISAQGNVGINNTNPQSRLDVRGDVNVSGTLRANGDPGSANQVLTKNSSGNMIWADMSGYKNFESFINSGSYSWVAPAGVTSIMVEVVGGGGGGIIHGGGGGGGYIAGNLIVTPGSSYNLIVGAGGNGGSGGNGASGESSSFTAGAIILIADGGYGTTFDNTTKYMASAGGGYAVIPANYKNFIAMNGASGEPNKISFQQKSPTTFMEISEGGSGGGPGYCRDCIGKGSYYAYDISTASVFRRTSYESRTLPGTGGGGGYSLSSVGGFGGGGYGRAGMVIIHY